MKRFYILVLVIANLAAFADESKYLLFYNGGEEILRIASSEVDSIVVARPTETPSPGPDVPPGAVDLGLSVMWAQCNLGAGRPGDFGGYYTFGSLAEQEEYNDESYHLSGHFRDESISGHPRYDAAYAALAGKWRIPTVEEFNELIEKCAFELVTDSETGHLCLRATGPNGNSILFPAGGWKSWSGPTDIGSYGWYHTSSPTMSDRNEMQWCFYFDPDGRAPITSCNLGRTGGLLIRPVYLGDEELWHKPEVPVGNAVDLGLSVEWADCNVGASGPYESGHIYSFADIDKKYGFSSTIHSYNPADYLFDKDLSDPAYDVAAYLWGDGWRIPSRAEWEELIANCSFEWQTAAETGRDGVKVTAPNGNSIFLSAEGRYIYWASDYLGREAQYWSSTPNTDDPGNRLAYSFLYSNREELSPTNPGTVNWTSYISGLPVRPVRDKTATRTNALKRYKFALPAPTCPRR